jgi:hypothetical protein
MLQMLLQLQPLLKELPWPEKWKIRKTNASPPSLIVVVKSGEVSLV